MMKKICQTLKMAGMGVVLGTALTFLAACDNSESLNGQQGNFYFSNPTEELISFKVDDKIYEVAPSESGKITLSSGMHRMESQRGHVTNFMVFDNNNGGILNPENQIYYELAMAYVVEGKGKGFMPATYSIMINGHELRIPVRSANEPIIDGKLFTCDYAVGELLPAEITTYNPKDEGKIRNKCFDKTELVGFLKSDFNMDLTSSSTQQEDSITHHFSMDIPKAAFLDAQTQNIAEQIIMLSKELIATDNTGIHKTANKKFGELISALVMAHVNGEYAGNREQNELYNDFVEQVSNLQSYGVLIR